jgi:dTDP-4-dehydrorhamnose reductase
MKKVFITGANGLLGQKCLSAFAKGWEVLGIDLQEAPFFDSESAAYQKMDFTDKPRLLESLEEFHPDVILNAGAFTDVDGCEKEKEAAYRANVEAVQNLVEYCSSKNCKLIQLSTDYLFDGKEGPYPENAEENPVGYYGQTKFEAEQLIKANLKNYLIARTNVLYGIANKVRSNFVTWLIETLKDGKPVRIVTDQYNNPILVDNLAEALCECAEMDLTGILNLGGGEYLSRYDFALKIAEVFELSKNLITPIITKDLGQVAPRPLRGGLDETLAMKLLTTKLLDAKEGLEVMKRQVERKP